MKYPFLPGKIQRNGDTPKHCRKKLWGLVCQWRPVIEYFEKDVWEVLKRYKVNPIPVTEENATSIFFIIDVAIQMVVLSDFP
ncbi:hypothetical protein [Petralouisia muris]|uniref:hypothetical protein n=1 Tax=Petralouisia muris TaxID=3032872 RepID=UPI001441BE87|nr:hypothetical protein [Petralouisia muris]